METVELKDDVYEYRVDVNKAKEVKVTLQPESNVLNIVVVPETSAEPTRYAVNIKVLDPTNANKDKNQEKPVKTEDTMTVLPVTVLMAACAAGVAVFGRKRREGRS